jgi:transposase
VQEKLRDLLEEGSGCGVSKVQKSCKQLLGLWPALWSFAHHAEVEPTNNEAERTLRAGVIWRKTSFGSQSGRGMRLVERLLTVAETCKKQQEKSLLCYLTALIEAYRSGSPAPHLLTAS